MFSDTVTAVLGLTDVGHGEPASLRLAKKEVQAYTGELGALVGFGELGTRDDDRLDDAGGDLGDADPSGFTGRAIDQNGLPRGLHASSSFQPPRGTGLPVRMV